MWRPIISISEFAMIVRKLFAINLDIWSKMFCMTYCVPFVAGFLNTVDSRYGKVGCAVDVYQTTSSRLCVISRCNGKDKKSEITATFKGGSIFSSSVFCIWSSAVKLRWPVCHCRGNRHYSTYVPGRGLVYELQGWGLRAFCVALVASSQKNF